MYRLNLSELERLGEIIQNISNTASPPLDMFFRYDKLEIQKSVLKMFPF